MPGYDEEAFGHAIWPAIQIFIRAKNLVEDITGKPMRVFGSRYFAYDETTLKAADSLEGVYLARGTQTSPP